MSLRSRLKRVERQANYDLPLAAFSYEPIDWERREEDYQQMLQAFSHGEFDDYPGGSCCLIAMLTNRLPEDFEKDILEVCGAEVCRKMLGDDTNRLKRSESTNSLPRISQVRPGS